MAGRRRSGREEWRELSGASGSVSALRSIWDETEEEDDAAGALWSLDRLIDADEAPTDPPRVAALALDPQDWRDAEAALGRELAQAAAGFARFDERLRAIGPRAEAAVERLAQTAAVDLLRREGEALSPDRLALWLVDRSSAGEDGVRLARAGWAAHRLAGGAGALLGAASLKRFLNLREGPDEDAAVGGEALEGWGARVRSLRDAHRLTQAGYALAAWRGLALSQPGVALEPYVAAMALAARAGRGGAPFAPLGRVGAAFGEGAGAAERLKHWYAEIEAGAEAALLTVERLADWEARALEGVGDLSGRTPRRLVDALSRRFALSAQGAATATEVSVSAAVRNMMLLERRGLLREMTGRGRFRLWSARL